jgi:hypothetical protein
MPYFIPDLSSVYFVRKWNETKGAAMKSTLVILISSAGIILSGCMSQQSATKQTTHEFIEQLPNHRKTEVYDRVVKWIGASFKSVRTVTEYQDKEVGSIVSYVNTDIKPEGPWVNMPVGFTMNVDVRNEKIRVRFTDLRRVYGSKKFQEPLNDEFFKTSTATAYNQAAHLKFNAIVQSLTYFIEQGKVAAADIYTPLSNR